MEKNRQTVHVLDEQGTVIGYTYPKRAKGLVNKCRAEFVSDNAIRLYKQCPTYENMEDKKMDKINYITVNPKAWRKNPDGGEKTICDRFMINNPLAGAIASAPSMVEILSIGSWNWNAGTSYVTNGFQALEPNTEYHLLFWLNGGENDRSDETCQLQILFTDDNVTASNSEFDKGLRFRLNRGYIKPLKKYNGWEYYDIPFTTTQTKYTQFQFVASRAPMALMSAEEPEVYKDLQDVADPFEKLRPQRHNIVFEDGWPVNQWYSTERLARQKGNNVGSAPTGNGSSFPNLNLPNFFEKAQEQFSPLTNLDLSDLTENITSEIMDNLDTDSLQDEIRDSIRDSIFDELDIDALRNEIMESVMKSLNPSN